MKKNFSLFLVLAITGCAFGAPTEYEKHRASQKSECELQCEKAHSEKDKDNRRRCVRICAAKKEMEAEQE